MNRSALPHLLNGLLLVALIGGSLWVYPTLPEQIPRHFNVYGQADAWGNTTLVHWLLVPVVALFSVGLIYAPAWIVGAVPASWMNVPDREAYEALPAAQKRHVRHLVQRGLYWMGTATLLIFGAVQASTYDVATTAATALPTAGIGAMGLGLFAIAGLTVWLIWGVPRRIRALSRPSDGEQPGDRRGD